ncbi:TPA: phage tail protein [Enterobacter hormaechei]
MTAKYYAILTTLGAAKLANAMALGTKLEITTMAVGDGGGVLPTPDASQTAIVGEQRRAPINMLSVDPANPGQIIAEQVIPENEGGFWIRTIGLYDKDGTLIAVANCPETYKPQLQEGSGRTQTIRMILIVSNTDAITLKIDPAVVLATRKYVDDKVIEVKAYADELMAAHLAAANPHNQYAPKASPALTGTPTAPTPVKTDNTTKLATTAHVKLVMADYAPLANPALTGTPTAPTAAQTVNNTQIATTAYVKAALAALVDSSPAALDTLNELAAALNDDPNFAATMTAELSKKMDKASNGADIPDIAAFLNNLGLGDASGYVGRLLKIQVFTASGTVTKTPGAKKWRIKCLGAGGGSSAAPATGSNEVSVSNGGGSGAYAEGIYDVSSITTASVVIGSGGAGGTAGSIYGADGGASSVGSFISSPGGRAGLPAGPANPPFQPVANNNSNSPTGWNIVGSSGAGAEPAVAVANSYAAGSRGSNSIFGVGGSIPAINSPANPGGGYGSGASGCSNGQSQSAKSGAAGRPGIVIIEELA